jgi:hypothetical protein
VAEQFKIEKGVPLPSWQTGRAGQSKYPFADLQVGDSFLVPHFAKTSQMSALIGRWQRTHSNQRFATRKVEGGGVRVWRIEDRPALKGAAE